MGGKLKPCPFCGGDARFLQPVSGAHPYIICNECFASCAPAPDFERIASAWNRRESGWQPIETAPKDGTPIMIWDDLNNECSIAHFVVGGDPFMGWFHVNDWTGGASFERWQPLPHKPSSPGDEAA